MCVWERYCTIKEKKDSNTGFIFIADAETDAKGDEEDKIEEDEKIDGNNEGPDTSLEKKKQQNNSAKTDN